MKKIAKFNPNLRNVGAVLTTSVMWSLFSDATAAMSNVAHQLARSEPVAHPAPEDRRRTEETNRLLPLALQIVRNLTPVGVEALYQQPRQGTLNEDARLQTSFRAETIDGESVLHMIKADRRPHPLLAKRNKNLYLVCHYYLYPDRETDHTRWEVEIFDDVTPERMADYLPDRRGSKDYPPLEGVKLACMAYLNYEFGQASDRSRVKVRSLAIRPNQLITAMGTLSTQALLEEMRVRWAEDVSTRKDDLWSAQEKRFLNVPTYPFEFNVDPSQRVESPNPNRDDCEVWELFVYRVANDVMCTSNVVRYTNEYQVLNKLGTSVSDRQARRHARLTTKYRQLAAIIREVGLNPPGDTIDVYSDQLGAKIITSS